MKTNSPLVVSDLPIGRNRVSFELGEREVLAVVGDNGVGKSLLLAHLTGHLRAAPGAVLVNGQAPQKARSGIGVVFQHHGLIRNMSAYENVALPFLVHGLDIGGELEKQVRLRMELTGCDHLADEGITTMSEGDKRCVALARALAGRVQLLVADEPVAALAPARKAMIGELLECLVRSGALRGMVIATQDLEFALRFATNLLILGRERHSLVASDRAAADPLYQEFICQTP